MLRFIRKHKILTLGVLIIVVGEVVHYNTSPTTTTAAPVASAPTSASNTPTSPTPSPSTPTIPVGLCAEPTCGYAQITNAIAGATSSVDMVMYELSDSQVEQALINDAKRGVNVRVLLDSAYDGHYVNDSTAAYLRANGVTVKLAPSSIIVHEKAVIINNDSLWLSSGNLVTKYFTSSANWMVQDNQPADVTAALTAFNGDWSGSVGTQEQGMVGDLLFSPNALNPYLALINSAQHTILISSEEMIEPQVIAALEAAAKRGVNVQLLMTSSNISSSTAASLRESGVHLDLVSPQNSLYIHAKTLVIDGSAALIGSQNDSTASLVYNRELSIELTEPALVNEVIAGFNHWLQQGGVA